MAGGIRADFRRAYPDGYLGWRRARVEGEDGGKWPQAGADDG